MRKKLVYIVSDIHANLEALQAVQKDVHLRQSEVDVTDVEIICLGDIVGYGPSFLPCLQWVKKRCGVCVSGNHEQAFLYPELVARDGLNPVAASVINWQRMCIQQAIQKGNIQVLHTLEWMKKLPFVYEDPSKGFLYVHGSLAAEGGQKPYNVYVQDDEACADFMLKMHSEFPFTQHGFYGHTHCSESHLAQVGANGSLNWLGSASKEIFPDYELTAEGGTRVVGSRFTWKAKEHSCLKGIHCPGSVGKTRMGDPGYAHFMILSLMGNGDIVFEFKVVKYDFEKFLKEFHKIFYSVQPAFQKILDLFNGNAGSRVERWIAKELLGSYKSGQ